MLPAYAIQIETPRGVVLHGLWIGPKRARRCVVWVHGLGSTMFSKLRIAEELAKDSTAVLVFNNRGHDKVSYLGGRTKMRGGSVHEVFTDCVDDIQGAIAFAQKRAKEIYLAGHSTGCQKSIYWASKKGRGVRGIIILAPMSDYASERKAQGARALKRAEKVAREYVRKGKGHVQLPENIWGWPWIADAQRFLSLYSGQSAEEIFPYWDKKRTPKLLRSVRKPVLVLLAEHDEYADRPPKELYWWFLDHIYEGEVAIVPRVTHSFKGGEKKVARLIRDFMKEV